MMYLTKEHCKGFDTYKYSCVDTSPLANYVMHPFWNQFVKLFPRWVAPNLMTFSGFILLLSQYILLCVYDPTYISITQTTASTIPLWVWWFSFFAQFFSHTLDGCDGKQARRTGTSSPLGELFDHGIDSWCVSFFTLNVFSIFGSDSVGIYHLYYIHVATMVAFVISHWEKYNTGVLYLPWAYDLSQVVLAIVYLVTAIYGADVWKAGFFGYNYCEIFQWMTYGGVVILTIPFALYNIHFSYKRGECKQSSIYEGCIPLISPFLLFIVMSYWVHHTSLLEVHPRMVTFTIGVLFTNIVARLIVAQMSSTRCQVFNKMLIILMLACVTSLSVASEQADYYLLLSTMIVCTIAHLHYAYSVVFGLADHLKIKVFSIKEQLD